MAGDIEKKQQKPCDEDVDKRVLGVFRRVPCIMRWNEQEMVARAHDKPDWEGRLLYTAPKTRSTAKAIGKGIVGTISGAVSGIKADETDGSRDRFFRLKANLLFYFRISSPKEVPRPPAEPMGLLVLENFHVQREDLERSNSFSIIFAEEPTRRHLLTARDKLDAYQWDVALRNASFTGLRDKLIELQIKIRNKLESDPLKGSPLENNPLFAPLSTTSKLLTSSDSQIAENKSPMPKPRTKKSKKSGFTLHMQEDFERGLPEGAVPVSQQPKATFQCHIEDDGVPVAPLLDL